MPDLAKAYNIDDLREIARRRLPRGLFEFIDRGAEDEVMQRNNRAAFDRVLFCPTTLIDTSTCCLETSFFGLPAKLPLAIAPTGIVGLVWYEGEIAAARAAARAGVPYTLSTASITPLEAVADKAQGELWFQLYVWPDLSLTFELVQRAKAAGYRALIVTVDSSLGANREYNKRNQFAVPARITPKTMRDTLLRPRWAIEVMGRSLMTNGVPRFANYPVQMQSDLRGRRKAGGLVPQSPAISYDLLQRLRDRWDGPLMVKGILHPADAVKAAACGADAIIVSNHGGRNLDAAVPAIDALPHIVAAVGPKTPVFMDSGVRRGSDVVKALALGAKAVMVGRAPIWGTAAAGEEGAYHALSILQQETRRIMGQIGYTDIAQVDRNCLWPLPEGQKSATASHEFINA